MRCSIKSIILLLFNLILIVPSIVSAQDIIVATGLSNRYNWLILAGIFIIIILIFLFITRSGKNKESYESYTEPMHRINNDAPGFSDTENRTSHKPHNKDDFQKTLPTSIKKETKSDDSRIEEILTSLNEKIAEYTALVITYEKISKDFIEYLISISKITNTYFESSSERFDLTKLHNTIKKMNNSEIEINNLLKFFSTLSAWINSTYEEKLQNSISQYEDALLLRDNTFKLLQTKLIELNSGFK